MTPVGLLETGSAVAIQSLRCGAHVQMGITKGSSERDAAESAICSGNPPTSLWSEGSYCLKQCLIHLMYISPVFGGTEWYLPAVIYLAVLAGLIPFPRKEGSLYPSSEMIWWASHRCVRIHVDVVLRNTV